MAVVLAQHLCVAGHAKHMRGVCVCMRQEGMHARAESLVLTGSLLPCACGALTAAVLALPSFAHLATL